MICEFIDTEQSESIIWIVRAKLSGNLMFTIHGDKIHSMEDAIDMDDTYSPLALLIELWAHQPHPCIFIRLVSNLIKPVHHSTWVVYIFEMKWKKSKDLYNLQAIHQLCVWVYIHKYAIITWGLVSPE